MSDTHHSNGCGRPWSSCTCGQPPRSGHETPEFYRAHGYCNRPCQECNRLDAQEAEPR